MDCLGQSMDPYFEIHGLSKLIIDTQRGIEAEQATPIGTSSKYPPEGIKYAPQQGTSVLFL